MNTETILILAPHTDDGELGCGATIAKHIEKGNEVFYVAFSSCTQSLPLELERDTLIHECYEATNALGIKKENVIFHDFEVRKFPAFRQEILEELVLLNKKIKPSAVYIPAANDIHQDHHTIYAEALRAFKGCNIFGYELPWNNTRFQPIYFESVSNAQIKVKSEALMLYQSQQHRKYMNELFIQSLAVVRGIQGNTQLAEAFEIYQYVR